VTGGTGYAGRVKITIEDELLQGLNLSDGEARIVLAVGLYADRRVTLGRGAHIAGISQPEFQRDLGRRRVPVNYDVAEFEADLHALREHPLA
jgi:predicted HTH domain antitoxin